MKLRVSRVGATILLLLFVAFHTIVLRVAYASTTSGVIHASAVSNAERNIADSFSGDTLVETDNGKRPIRDLKIGDKVLAYDEDTGETGYHTIQATISHQDFTVREVVISGERIETTPEHPFLTRERGWVTAINLKMGDHVRRADGSFGIVQSVGRYASIQRMYNLTVEDANTYFVGEQQWLVHNCAKKARKPPAPDNYRGRHNAKRAAEGKPRLPDEIDSHHRIPQVYMDHPEFKDFDFHNPDGQLRGIPGSRAINNIHQKITNIWERFRARLPTATRAQIEKLADAIDRAFKKEWYD